MLPVPPLHEPPPRLLGCGSLRSGEPVFGLKIHHNLRKNRSSVSGWRVREAMKPSSAWTVRLCADGCQRIESSGRTDAGGAQVPDSGVPPSLKQRPGAPRRLPRARGVNPRDLVGQLDADVTRASEGRAEVTAKQGAPENEMEERMREGRKLSRTARIIAAAVLGVIAAAGPAEAVCELLASSAAGMTGLRIGTAIGSRMGIAAGGMAIAGTWPVGLTLGSLLATGTGVVLLATPAACLALASAAGATTVAPVALAVGITAAGAAIIVLMSESELRARGDRPSSRQAPSGVASGSHMGSATVQRCDAGGRRFRRRVRNRSSDRRSWSARSSWCRDGSTRTIRDSTHRGLAGCSPESREQANASDEKMD